MQGCLTSISGDIDSDDLLCKKSDYGSSPKEVVEYRIEQAYQSAHNIRRYDSDEDLSPPKGVANVSNVLRLFYKKWSQLRDHWFDGLSGQGTQKTSVWHYSSLIPQDVTAYNTLIKEQAEKKIQTESEKEFARYYEVRQPIFDFFKQLFFFPTKYCIYKKGESYQAISLDVIHSRLEHKYKDKDNRAIIRHCLSPEVITWVEEKNKDVEDKMTFVTEVGYFATDRSYFINPQISKDRADEVSLFSVWLDSTYKLSFVLNEPDFRAEFFKEWKNYLVDGLDLNPYINLKVPDESAHDSTVKLDRVLSYEADFLSHPLSTSSILYNRLYKPLQMAHSLNKNKEVSDLAKHELRKQLSLTVYNRPFLQQLFASVSQAENPAEELQNIMLNQGYETKHPLMYSFYEEYSRQQQEQEQEVGTQAFIAFILNNSLVYSKPDNKMDQRLFMPVIRDGLLARVILRLREYWDCIDKDDKGEKACPDIEAKRIYRALIHNIWFK